MSELKLISPMLDRFAVGDSISEHHGVSCYPAMEDGTNSKYIVKVISIPASRTQLDALLLTGAYPDEASALVYFKELADGVVEEIDVLNRLADHDGFLGFEQHQLVPMDDSIGFNLYLLGTYKRTLTRQMQKQPLTHLGALNLALDMCASLTLCRRYGYLYADLKPDNIYVMESGSFRIGDLGFLRLDSLKYASLPDKYRSSYTAPEIADAFCELNSTIDVYALGTILYQIYNNGELPEADNSELAAPANADYELSEIILKACAIDPAERWEDPAQLGQAIVSYMQRNGANDTPIIPPVVPVAEPAPVEDEVDETEAADEETVIADEDDSQQEDSFEAEETEALPVDPELQEITDLLEADNDETDPSFNDEEINYEEVSEEISEILTQADEIAEHPVPEPVVAPEPVEISIPEPECAEENTEDKEVDPEATIAVTVDNDDADEQDADETEDAADTDDTMVSDEDSEEDDASAKAPVKKRRWLRTTILILVLLGILTAGFFFYTQYYLLPIESVVLDGHEDVLTVKVTTTIDESLLTVICKDQHGNQLTAPVENGVAVFNDLIPDTGYTVTVAIAGFHKLTGDYSKAYSTPVETNIAQFTAVAGYEDGSVILAFTVEGRDASEWNVICHADGETDKTVTTQNKSATITGLTLDKEYTFELKPSVDLFVTGQTTLTFKSSKLAYAQDLVINELTDGKLSISWNAPKDVAVENWSVYCTDGDQYAQTVVSTKTSAEFENIDAAKEYTITVTAAGMSVNKQIVKPANAISLTNVKLDEYPTYAELTWECNADFNEDWFVSFTVDGLASTMTSTTDDCYFRVPYIIPGAVYRISIKGVDGTDPLGGTYVFTAAEPKDYENEYGGKKVTNKDMSFTLCTPPSWDYWKQTELDADDYTTQIKLGQKAGMILQINTDFGASWDEIFRVFAVYDKDGKLVACGYTTANWSNMLYNGYGALDIPFMPEATGEYTLRLFFNGQFVTEQAFTITE